MIWLIGVGGSLGSAVRFMLGSYFNKIQKGRFFPLGTLLINISGSLLLGILTSLHLANRINEWIWFLLGIGFCGAYTTFSTFGYEVITLVLENNRKKALIYVILSAFVGVFAATVGYLLASSGYIWNIFLQV